MSTPLRFVAKNGLDNNSNSILNIGASGSSLTLSGANSVTLTSTGSTNVTLPTTGTLATTTQLGSYVLKAGDTMTGVLAVPLGSATAPSLTYSGDTNTGTFSPTADTYAIATGGSERLRVDSSGNIGFGSSSVGGASGNFRFNGNITGATSSNGILYTPTVLSGVTTAAVAVQTQPSTQAAAFTLVDFVHFRSTPVTIGSTSAVTNQYGFSAPSTLTTATNNFGFHSNIASGTGRWNFYAAGTAANYFGGDVTVVGNLTVTDPVVQQTDIGSEPNAVPLNQYLGKQAYLDVSFSNDPTVPFGYVTGAGGAVTQTTSRTTGVTINRPSGSITLVSAAGSATWQSFTVTNSIVSASDNVIVNQRSGTDLYMIHVTAVAAGSFRITFATTGGTTTEQPVLNFSIIKGADL